VEQREIAALGLVIASADRSEALECVEANLDEVANPIELAIKRQRSLARNRSKRSCVSIV
jgi:hypothetical protein